MNLFKFPYLYYVEETTSFRGTTMDICGYNFGSDVSMESLIEKWTTHEWKSLDDLDKSAFYKVRLK